MHYEEAFGGFHDGDLALYDDGLESILVRVLAVRTFGCLVEALEAPNSTFFAYFRYLKRTSPLEELARCAE